MAGALALLAVPGHAQETGPGILVGWSPAQPAEGSFAFIVVQPDSGPASSDPATTVTGEMAGERLHFERDSAGAFRALGAAPLGAHPDLSIALTIGRRSGAQERVKKRLRVNPQDFPVERLSVEPKFVDPPDSALAARIARERRLARAVTRRSHDTPRVWRREFHPPRGSRITSQYGMGREYNGVLQSRHLGVDFAGAAGAPVLATNDGVVALVGDFYYSGTIVYLDHGEGLVTAYLHLSSTDVAPGDTVSRGQLVGRVGASGRVTGPHLHWHAKYGRLTLNPLTLLELVPPTRRVGTPVDAGGLPENGSAL